MTTVRSKTFGIEVPRTEYSPPGHSGCAGCAAMSVMRLVLKVLGPRVIVTNPAGCLGGIPLAIDVPVSRALFEAAAAWASGIKAALEIRGDYDTQVLAYTGDGATYDIGMASLSAAAERNENFIYLCSDNEAYMATGIQRSSATPKGAWTTTTPLPAAKVEEKKDIVAIMAAHRVPYIATATLAYPRDLVRKLEKAKSIQGFRFFNVLAPCPTGWRFNPNMAVQISRLAVMSRVFPLLEIENGVHYTVQRPTESAPVREYIRSQGRFAHLTDAEIDALQRKVDVEWEYLAMRSPVYVDLAGQ